jgi:hypothetical protein
LPNNPRAKDMLAEGAIKEEDAEDGWVIAETKGND